MCLIVKITKGLLEDIIVGFDILPKLLIRNF